MSISTEDRSNRRAGNAKDPGARLTCVARVLQIAYVVYRFVRDIVSAN